MSDYQETLQFLYGLQSFGIKVGLHNIQRLLDELNHPEKYYPCIHIAGTNGKGSTAALIAAVLTASGYRTGIYTSPHLVHFNERIRIDGIKISEDVLVAYTKSLKPSIIKLRATFFEVTTAIAFKYFAQKKVDIAVIETGLGGRLDATNIIQPVVSIITNIGLEHTDILGGTIEQIAFEKGGIIKSSAPCVTGATHKTVLGILKKISKAKKIPFIQTDSNSSIKIHSSSLNGTEVSISNIDDTYNRLYISLAGEHQIRNAQLALLCLGYIKRSMGFSRINNQTVFRGFKLIRELTGIRGRLDTIHSRRLVITDVAHNPEGVKTLITALNKLWVGKMIVLFGVMRDKDYRSMLNLLQPVSRLTIAVRPSILRALENDCIVSVLHKMHQRAYNGGTVVNGLKIGFNESRSREPVLVTGSHYVVGQILHFLKVSI